MQNNFNVTKEIIKSWVNGFFEQIPMISNIAFLIGLFVVIRYSEYFYWQQSFLMLSLYFILIQSIQSFDRWRKKQNQIGRFPVNKKRFTKKLDEAIVVKKSDWEEAMLYLSEVEDYLGK